MIHEFYTKIRSILNSNRSRAVILTGNIDDIYYDGSDFVPIIEFLSKKLTLKADGKQKGITQVIYEVNQEVRVVGDEEELRKAWNKFIGANQSEFKKRRHSVSDEGQEGWAGDYNTLIKQTGENTTFALEFLRQLTVMSRGSTMKSSLVIIIEAADMLLPENTIASMSFPDRKRIFIMKDWLTDPKFHASDDSLILISESRTTIHSTISRMKQVLSVTIPAPSQEERIAFAEKNNKPNLFVDETAGLTLQAYRQILLSEEITLEEVVDQVEEFIIGQLGEDVVEFKRPTHTLDDVIGYDYLKTYIHGRILPRFRAKGSKALPGVVFAGPIGGGKTHIGEAIASVVDMPVLILKNIRNMWYGQTDVIIERFRRLVEALGRVVVFLDEADTMFSNLGRDTQDTERRLTGKIQSMMSDKRLRGKVFWILMTARVWMLSPDIRRNGRVGELCIPILDPQPEDRLAFVNWMMEPIGIRLEAGSQEYESLHNVTKEYSAADYLSGRGEIEANECKTVEDAIKVIEDILPADISKVRRYQTLQALINCRRKSLIPSSIPYDPDQWRSEMRELEIELKDVI